MANLNGNRRVNRMPAKDTNTKLNHEGAVVHALNLIEELYARAQGSYMGEGTFYEKNSPEDEFARIREIVSQLPAEDAEYALKIAAIARESNMISTPLAILTACFNDNKFRGAAFVDEDGVNKLGRYSDLVVRRGRDITDILGNQFAVYGRSESIPKQERKCLKRKLEQFDAYQISKALGKGRAVSMADAVKLLRPANKNDFFKSVIEDNVKFGNGKAQVQAELTKVNSKNNASTVEDIKASIESSSLMAIVKNLVALQRANALDDNVTKIICDKLTNRDVVKKSRMLPYQIYDAYCMFSHNFGKNCNAIADALVCAVDYSVDNVADIDGYSAIFVDLSGSMGHSVSSLSSVGGKELAALLGAIAAKKGNSRVFAFANRAQEVQVSRHSTVVDIVKNILSCNVGGCTYFTAALDAVLKTGEKFDNVILLSDNDCYQYDTKRGLTLGGYSYYGGSSRSADDIVSEYIAKGVIKRFFVNNLLARDFAIVNTDDYRKNLVTGFTEKYIDAINGSIELAREAGDIRKLIDMLFNKYFGPNGTSVLVAKRK